MGGATTPRERFRYPSKKATSVFASNGSATKNRRGKLVFLSPLQLLTIGIFFCASALKKFRYGDRTTIEIRTMIVNAIAS